MNKRKLIVTLAGVGVVALCILLASFLKREPKEKKEDGATATAVNAELMEPGAVSRYIDITGRLIPKQRVQLFAEVGGIARFGQKPFKEGITFEKGELMLAINSEEIQSALAAQRSNFQSQLAGVIPDLKLDFVEAAPEWEAYLDKLDITGRLPELPTIEDKTLKLFLSGRSILTSYYTIREAETRLDKYVVRAPFMAAVTEATLDEGTLVRVGQPIGTIISRGAYELEAGLSYLDAKALSVGTEFELDDVNTKATYKAKVVRVNDQVDPETQQVKIYAEINDQNAKSGIYLDGKVEAEKYQNAVRLPLSALVDDAGLYVVRDSMAVLTPVEVLYKDAETAIVKGMEKAENVITDTYNESLDGSKVTIVNIEE